MIDIFFNTEYTSLPQLLIRVLAFALVSILLLYLIYFILAKTLYRKSKSRREINLRLTFLWSVFVYSVIFNVYIFTLLHISGAETWLWTNPIFYLGISVQLIVYFGLIIFFFIKRRALINIIHKKSIN